MSESSNRRDFITGKSSRDRLVEAASGVADDADASIPESNRDRESAWLEEYTRSAMACQFSLMFNMHQYPQSGAVTMAAFELLDRLEQQMTVYREDSEISRLNVAAKLAPVVVEEELYGLLSLARDLFSNTGGAFDMTAGRLSSIWGFRNRSGMVPPQTAIEQALINVGTDKIRFDDNASTITLPPGELEINLGGIGKGYAIDRIATRLTQQNVLDFIIHGGQSSVAARGNQSNADSNQATPGWPVGLSHPNLPDRRLAQFFLTDESLATSGTGRQGFFHEGRRYGHVIDPRTGWPTDHHLSATVIAPSAAVCDALATAFFVMTMDEIEAYCSDHESISAVIVRPADRDRMSGSVQIDSFNMPENAWERI